MLSCVLLTSCENTNVSIATPSALCTLPITVPMCIADLIPENRAHSIILQLTSVQAWFLSCGVKRTSCHHQVLKRRVCACQYSPAFAATIGVLQLYMIGHSKFRRKWGKAPVEHVFFWHDQLCSMYSVGNIRVCIQYVISLCVCVYMIVIGHWRPGRVAAATPSVTGWPCYSWWGC